MSRTHEVAGRTTAAPRSASKGQRVLLAALLVFAAAKLVDFAFHGLHLHDLAAALGLALAAVGTYRRSPLLAAAGAVVGVVAIAVKQVS